MTPPELAFRLQSLPPILHILYQASMSSCSKGSRGLSVLPWVICIFTDNSISPSPSLRQYPDRCTIRAGRNLPDKEFRYLRTVIVTAAVYWGFNSELAPLLLTFQHRAGVSPYTSIYIFAETYVFDKQSPGSFHCNLPKQAILLPKLRMYFAEFLNERSLERLRILTSPTCVGLRYGHPIDLGQRLFLGSVTTWTSFPRRFSRIPISASTNGFTCLSQRP